MLLVEAKKGTPVRIAGFLPGKNIGNKLRQLGIIPGDKAQVVREAPLGGPLLIRIQDREIALGKKVAAYVLVEEIECD